MSSHLWAPESSGTRGYALPSFYPRLPFTVCNLGASKLMQEHVERCLEVCLDQPEALRSSTGLTLAILRLVEKQCHERVSILFLPI